MLVRREQRAVPAESWDLHLGPVEPRQDGGFDASVGVFPMKPRSRGRVRLRSDDPRALPLVERGFLTDDR